MSATLYLVRHGRTAWNGARFLGRLDVPLDALGRRQADELPERLAAIGVDVILTSPLRRAWDTAEPLARGRGLVPEAIDDLVELDCGELQGRLKSEHGKLAKRDPADPFPGGESLGDVFGRAARVAGRLHAELRSGRDVVVVGHYVVNQMLLGALRGDGPADALWRLDYRPAPGSAYAWSPSTGIRPVEATEQAPA